MLEAGELLQSQKGVNTATQRKSRNVTESDLHTAKCFKPFYPGHKFRFTVKFTYIKMLPTKLIKLDHLNQTFHYLISFRSVLVINSLDNE